MYVLTRSHVFRLRAIIIGAWREPSVLLVLVGIVQIALCVIVLSEINDDDNDDDVAQES